MSKFIVALAFIGLNVYTYHFFANTDYTPSRESLTNFPHKVDNWRCRTPETMPGDTLDNLGVTDYILCTFINKKDRKGEGRLMANLYVGYHESQTRTSEGGETIIHPPEHCLPGSGWDIIDTKIVPINFGIPGEAKRVVIAKENSRSLVYFWYQSRGRVIARNHEKILYMFLDRALERRTDGSLVRFTIPIAHGDEETADATFRSLAASVSPLLPKYVPN